MAARVTGRFIEPACRPQPRPLSSLGALDAQCNAAASHTVVWERVDTMATRRPECWARRRQRATLSSARLCCPRRPPHSAAQCSSEGFHPSADQTTAKSGHYKTHSTEISAACERGRGGSCNVAKWRACASVPETWRWRRDALCGRSSLTFAGADWINARRVCG